MKQTAMNKKLFTFSWSNTPSKSKKPLGACSPFAQDVPSAQRLLLGISARCTEQAKMPSRKVGDSM